MMTRRERPVDHAMSQDRPEKRTIRELWIEKISQRAAQESAEDTPLYLTLPGAEGRDIQLLIDRDLLAVTEVMSINESDQNKVVAVESSNLAVASLQTRFTGLRILQVPFQDLIRGDHEFSWPQGDHERFCRARVVNLDLNTCLHGKDDGGAARFPIILWIKKLCQLHGRHPRTDWTLCLTLHGEISCPESVAKSIQNFLRENMQREPVFEERCRSFLGQPLFEHIVSTTPLRFTEVERGDQQAIVMVVVPKLIAHAVHSDGWRVETVKNLRYGATDQAPMVSWILDFAWDAAGGSTPNALYREAIAGILLQAGAIGEDGQIT